MPESIKNIPVEIVAAGPETLNYILGTWVSNNRKSRWCEAIPAHIYYRDHAEVVKKLLETSTVYVARWSEDPEQIYGWVAFSRRDTGLVIHYCYVGAKYRRLGIGSALLGCTGYRIGDTLVASHYPKIADPKKGWLRQRIKVTYNPYVIGEIINEG